MTVEMHPISPGQPISVEEFDALPEDTSMIYEIENGFLLVNARPAPPHSRVLRRLANQIDDQLPSGWEAFEELDAELPVGKSPRRAPDLVVAPEETDEQMRVRSDQIALAIEISSSGGSAFRDYSIKAREYEANGIPHYWVVDLLGVGESTVGLTVFTLGVDGRYEVEPRVTGIARVEKPFPLTIDLDALIARKSDR